MVTAPAIDAYHQQLMDKVFEEGALLFLPDELWMTGNGRLLH
jgi:hypothetical protein